MTAYFTATLQQLLRRHMTKPAGRGDPLPPAPWQVPTLDAVETLPMVVFFDAAPADDRFAPRAPH